jgi:hypothetical protein
VHATRLALVPTKAGLNAREAWDVEESSLLAPGGARRASTSRAAYA